MKKLVVLFLITCGFLTAQVTTSSISGIIVDDANMELEAANSIWIALYILITIANKHKSPQNVGFFCFRG